MIATARGRTMTAERWAGIADVLERVALGSGDRLSGGLVDELRALGSAAFKYQAENRELNRQLDAAIKRAVAAEHELGWARGRLSSIWSAISQFHLRPHP